MFERESHTHFKIFSAMQPEFHIYLFLLLLYPLVKEENNLVFD